ncbi:hypothetical protein HYPSUDRAFT_55217 [Hypholoma sublateritium FD-334 SS-4]|uniref:Uncharacterized protein n=1 Tax=Hypholoma sublateritium (strain FD-334 SS-4) TaxID=945553 RepID=A0A0D2L4V0_HYPSF|nr:hypothetical protein HYPSUDRAFT_55217 [Hypholoma sublateritium FD-334 SS-4]
MSTTRRFRKRKPTRTGMKAKMGMKNKKGRRMAVPAQSTSQPKGEPGGPWSGRFKLTKILADLGWSKESIDELTNLTRQGMSVTLDAKQSYRQQDKDLIKHVAEVGNNIEALKNECDSLLAKFVDTQNDIKVQTEKHAELLKAVTDLEEMFQILFNEETYWVYMSLLGILACLSILLALRLR